MIEETLAGVVERFNRHTERNPGLRAEIAGLSRTIVLKFTDVGPFSVVLRGGRLDNLRSGAPERSDLTITTDSATFESLVKKELGPMKALVTRRLSIDGSLEDKLLLRRLL
jgi:putative sterol carrier protein